MRYRTASERTLCVCRPTSDHSIHLNRPSEPASEEGGRGEGEMTTAANAKLAGHFLPTPSLPRQTRRRLSKSVTNRASFDGLLESHEFKLEFMFYIVEADSGFAFESLLFVPESHL